MRATIPSIRELMENPVYRAYMKRVPPAHHANNNGEPWRVWVRTSSSKWLTRTYASYRDVWPVFITKFRDREKVADATITSRRVFYAPPGHYESYRARVSRKPTPTNPATTEIVTKERWIQDFAWDHTLSWCGRCRRPVHWLPLFTDHHALKNMPAVTTEDNHRCIICGIRWISQPPIDQMERFR